MSDFKVGDKVRYAESFLSDSPFADILRAKVFVVAEVQPTPSLRVPLFLGFDDASPASPGHASRFYLDARLMEVVHECQPVSASSGCQ